MQVTVRRAVTDDFEQINTLREMVKLFHADNRPDFFTSGFSKGDRELLLQRMNAENVEILVATFEDKVVGFSDIEFVHRQKSEVLQKMRSCHIHELAVSPEFQRRGVATSLMETIKNEAQLHDCEKLELSVWEFNDSARECYEALGFETYLRRLELTL